MKPNIFKIATKELSQDAFITWLLQFADESCNTINKELNLSGINFVNQLIKKQIPNFNEEIKKIKAGRQWENIDVWAEVNDKYLIIIEDKTNTGKRGNQLTRYKQTASEWCNKNKYEDPICIYLKTGNESQRDLREIIRDGFSIFNRQDFIAVLNNHPKIENDIFIDFKENLERKEKLNNEFFDKKIGDWKNYDYVGFYQLLEKKMEVLHWHYVDNASGGFWNALLSWTYWDIYPTYIQIEEHKLCFKISTHPVDVERPTDITRGKIRNNIYKLIIDKAKEFEFKEIKKPNRFGDGNYMTVAIVERDHWLGSSDSIIDIDKVVQNLEKYLNFLRDKVKVK
jgi:hypothetical protein